jgi:hypothetical protein
MAEEVNINIKISSNLDATAAKASKSIDEVKKSADDASKSIEKTGTVTEKATQLIDKFTGGLASKIKSITKYSKELGTGLVTAFKAGTKGASSLQKAIISTGIGALVVAVGLLVAYWDDIVGFISGASSEQKHLLAETEKTAQAQQAALDAISLQENSLRLAGKSEKEIRDLKIQQTNETITALEAQLQAQETIKKSQVDASKRNKEILQGIIRFLTLPLSTLLATVDMVGEALGKDFGLEEKFTGGIAKLVFDPEEVAEAADETIKETQDQLAKLKSARDGFLVQDKKEQADAAKAASDQAAKDADARIAKEKETQAAIAALNKETLDLIAANQEAALKDETERENTRFANLQAKLTREREEQIKAAEGNEVLIAAINAKYDALEVQAEQAHATTLENISKASQDKLNAQLQQAADIRTSLIANEQERELATIQAKYNQDLLAAENNEELKAALTARYEADKFAIKKNYADQESKLRRDTLNAELDVVKGAFDAIGEIAGEQSVLGKASAVASAVINTYQAATNALANTPAPPPFPQIAAGVAIASGLASVRKILQTPVPDGNGGLSSGGGGSLPSASTIQQPQFNIVGQSGTNQLAQSIGGQFSQPIRAYVVGGDVTTSQQLERQRVKTATFG